MAHSSSVVTDQMVMENSLNLIKNEDPKKLKSFLSPWKLEWMRKREYISMIEGGKKVGGGYEEDFDYL